METLCLSDIAWSPMCSPAATTPTNAHPFLHSRATSSPEALAAGTTACTTMAAKQCKCKYHKNISRYI